MTELNDDTRLYRIFNFHDLINTLSACKVRLSQVSRMEDPNELFGIYFDLQRSVFGETFGPNNAENVDRTQRKFSEAQSHHYMTCWTRAPDNLAVWSLYSPKKDAIQACVTYGALRKALNTHFKEYPYTLAYKLEPNDQTDLFEHPHVGPVRYVDFNEDYTALRQQCLDYFEERDSWFEAQEKDKSKPVLAEQFSQISERAMEWLEKDDKVRARVFEEPRLSGPLLKDHRYLHEKEVRFVLSLKRRDGRSKSEYEADPMAGLDHPCRHPKSEDCPPNVFVPFPNSNFIDFQVDGRIESYKFDAISNVLSKFGFELSRNAAFYQIEI
jgi:hypothetical protein